MKLIVLDGPDGCGKTEIAKGLSLKLHIPYFKPESEKENWAKSTYLEELRFGERRQIQIFEQLQASAVIDRGHASEWVYSQVFGRKTDMDFLKRVDERYAAIGTKIIIPWREDYSKNRDDDIIPNDRLRAIHDMYFRFIEWTECDTIPINVDYHKNNLESELGYLLPLVKGWNE